MKNKKRISILFVPSDGSGGREINLGWGLFRALVALMALSIVLAIFSVISVWKLWEYRTTIATLRSENAYLKDENAKIAKLAETLDKIKAIDHRLREMLGKRVRPVESPRFTVKASFEGYSEPLGRPVDSSFDEIEWAILRQRELSRYIPSIWPVKGWVTAEFEEKARPFKKRHVGIDIAAPRSSIVVATADGVVEFAGYDSELGNLVVIRHGGRFMTRYGHNSRILVRSGEIVKRGQPIALVGSTGKSTACHLHYEVWKNGKPVNPRDFMLRE